MKKVWLIILSFGLFSGCTTVAFLRPQPNDAKDLDSFPKELQGKYLFCLEEKQADSNCVIVQLTDKQLQFLPLDSSQMSTIQATGADEINLSDKQHYVLRQDKRGYYLSVLSDDNERQVWEVFAIRKKGANIVLSVILISRNNAPKRAIRKVMESSQVIALSDSSNIVLDPSSKQFAKLVKKGFFNSRMELKQMP
ncbi:MAG: hypothetical protein SFW35_09010 [Chitinophagales bacterium]|nr:hypothetical protein [Chitinophagales bacterium]